MGNGDKWEPLGMSHRRKFSAHGPSFQLLLQASFVDIIAVSSALQGSALRKETQESESCPCMALGVHHTSVDVTSLSPKQVYICMQCACAIAEGRSVIAAASLEACVTSRVQDCLSQPVRWVPTCVARPLSSTTPHAAKIKNVGHHEAQELPLNKCLHNIESLHHMLLRVELQPAKDILSMVLLLWGEPGGTGSSSSLR